MINGGQVYFSGKVTGKYLYLWITNFFFNL